MTPVPDELWLPLKQRVDTVIQISKASGIGLLLASGAGFVDLLVMPLRDPTIFIRVTFPLGIACGLTALVCRIVAGRTLARMRRLMAEHHGVDPG